VHHATRTLTPWSCSVLLSCMTFPPQISFSTSPGRPTNSPTYKSINVQYLPNKKLSAIGTSIRSLTIHLPTNKSTYLPNKKTIGHLLPLLCRYQFTYLQINQHIFQIRNYLLTVLLLGRYQFTYLQINQRTCQIRNDRSSATGIRNYLKGRLNQIRTKTQNPTIFVFNLEDANVASYPANQL
jgi:hypothetical protein